MNDYTDPPSDVAGEANKIVSPDSQHLKSASAHVALHEGKLIAAFLLVQVQPRYADLTEVQQNIMPGMAEDMVGSGVSVTWETMHSEKVVVARSDSAALYAWYHNGEVTMVTGDTLALLLWAQGGVR